MNCIYFLFKEESYILLKKKKKKQKNKNKTKQGSYMVLIKKWDRMLNEITSNATHGKTS